MITHEAKHFVRTGQRSIVDDYLSDSQTEQALTAYEFFKERMRGTVKELAVITGKPADSFECPLLSERLINTLNPKSRVNASPYMKKAVAEIRVAQEKLKREQADYLPKIVAVASTGIMESTHLVKKQHYAVGLGVILPIIDFNVKGHINKAHAQLLARQQDIEAQKQFIEEMNAEFDQIILSSTTQIKHLVIELDIARKGFKVAKDRYFSLEGSLVDLRDAWRILARVETTIEDARTDLLQAIGAKALLNGG